MTNENVAIVLIDPYNDFLHQDGKLNPMVRNSLQKTDTITNLHKLMKFARNHRIPVFYCLHQQSHDYSMQGWNMMNPSLTGIKTSKVFEEGSWGVEFYTGMEPDVTNGDVVVSKHWNSRYEFLRQSICSANAACEADRSHSSFQNTDLDYQLRQRGIRHVVMAGMVANTCLESTARYAYEQ
jgi:nicotinamidase-related amidase